MHISVIAFQNILLLLFHILIRVVGGFLLEFYIIQMTVIDLIYIEYVVQLSFIHLRRQYDKI